MPTGFPRSDTKSAADDAEPPEELHSTDDEKVVEQHKEEPEEERDPDRFRFPFAGNRHQESQAQKGHRKAERKGHQKRAKGCHRGEHQNSPGTRAFHGGEGQGPGHGAHGGS